MNLLIDESIDGAVVYALRREGHKVIYVAELNPGISDDQVLSMANDLHALLITADKDFGELVFRCRQVNAGVLLIRLQGLSQSSKADLVVATLRDHSDEIMGALSVLSPGMIRIRKQ